jgi:hypothetical protein
VSLSMNNLPTGMVPIDGRRTREGASAAAAIITDVNTRRIVPVLCWWPAIEG